jgi:RNA polymerase sigma factor (sigma-70 family)
VRRLLRLEYMVQRAAAEQAEPAELEPRNPLQESGANLDRDVLAALDRGDRRRALSILMRGYGDRLHRYCYGMLRDQVMADDVHQTVFVQVFQDFDTFSGQSSLRGWLYSIAHHRCLDALKISRRWLKRFSLQEALPEETDPEPSSDEMLVARAISLVLNECLSALNPQVRAAVLLRYQEGFSYQEMSRMCREPPATLQTRVARAMPALRRCLEAKGVRL